MLLMHEAHLLIFVCGALAAICILAGSFAVRFKAPLLLIFLALGMLAGEDGIGGIVFNNFGLAYLLGSLALVVILFEGGLKTQRSMLKLGLVPAALLGTVGVAITAGAMAALSVWLFHLDWPQGLLVGAASAPTDAAAVATLLRIGGFYVPPRVGAILEMESGLNDPISVVLMVIAVQLVLHPAGLGLGGTAILLLRQMGGGAIIGIAGGAALVWLLRRLKAEPGVFPVLAIAGAMMIFGGAQAIEASGFLAAYLAGYIVGNYQHDHAGSVWQFFDAFSWAAQIGLFLLLGLLVTPHLLVEAVKPALVAAVFLMLVARPLAGLLCLAPCRVPLKEIGFISWVGLRGAAPIYLTIIPVLSGLPRARLLFELVFVLVVTSLIVQGWTLGLVARLFRFKEA